MKTCFLISPIGLDGSEVRRRADDLLQVIVQPVCEKLGYAVVRADSVVRAGVITQQVIELAITADLVIGDLTGANPNVMYELGIRHAVGLPVIQMVERGEHLPFDIASYRTLMYQLGSPRDVLAACKELERMIVALQEHKRQASPVTDVAQRIAFESRDPTAVTEDMTPLLRSLLDRMGAIEDSLKRITSDVSSVRPKSEYSRVVFIVHGHDGELKNELARLLQRLELNPIILHEQPDRGQTIIQKLEYERSRVGFAFIIHTPDDEGRKRDADLQLMPRSRQNVIFEHGMFVGQFAHTRVCAIVKEGVEIPTDLSGVVYKRVSPQGGIASIAFEIVSELRAAGYVVDANKLLA